MKRKRILVPLLAVFAVLLAIAGIVRRLERGREIGR